MTNDGLVQIALITAGSNEKMGKAFYFSPHSSFSYGPNDPYMKAYYYTMSPEQFRTAVDEARANNTYSDGEWIRSWAELDSLSKAVRDMEAALPKPSTPDGTINSTPAPGKPEIR